MCSGPREIREQRDPTTYEGERWMQTPWLCQALACRMQSWRPLTLFRASFLTLRPLCQESSLKSRVGTGGTKCTDSFAEVRNIDTGIAVTALTIHCCPVPSARCSWLDEPCCRPLLTPEMLRRCCYVALVMVGSLSCVDIVGIFSFCPGCPG